MNRKIAFGFWLMAAGCLPAGAQRVLTLDSCRQMALRNNKQLSISKMKQDVAANERKSARTKYLPHVNALGTYVHTTKEVSILNDDQKLLLSNVGTGLVSQLPAQIQEKLGGLQTALNALGQDVVDAFRTDTRDIFAGTVALTQPVFMGGSIIAFNKIADIKEKIAANALDASRQSTLYTIDQAYWQVVSLYHKQKLAQSYLDLVQKFDTDVYKMIDEGVATKSDGLSVDVKVNEAEMTLTKVNDGLVLSRMLLNQLCGLPLDEQVTLADEQAENIAVVEIAAKPDGRGKPSRVEAAGEYGGPVQTSHQCAEGRQSATGGTHRRLSHQQSQCVQRLREEVFRDVECRRLRTGTHLELGRRDV